MNTRMPYFPLPTPPNGSYHTTFPPPFHPTMPPPTNISTNWYKNNGRSNWKRNRNWNQYNGAQGPYTVPKKSYNNRYQQNRNNSNGNNFFDKKSHILLDPKDGREQEIPGIVATKKKRKPMSKSYPSAKWNEEDASKALSAEKDFARGLTNQSLIIKFPDPELGKETVKAFHTAIENVHFPQPSTPRYCFAHLKEDANLEEVVKSLEKIPFGQGYLQVELKKAREDNLDVSPRDIDPYTLYVGNLPLSVTKAGVHQHFLTSTRIDIGHPQQMKNTRYAFVRFGKVEDAIAAYKNTFNTLYESRSMIVRFRRINGNVGIPGEIKGPPNKVTKEAPSPELPLDIIPDIPTEINSPINETVYESQSPMPTKQPDLSLVKEEPQEYEEREEIADIKPTINNIQVNGIDTTTTRIKTEIRIKNEIQPILKNEDDVEDEEEEEEFDARNDNFRYNNEGGLEDECDDFEDDDDYDVDDEDLGLQMNGTDTFLPGDDDEDIFSEK